MKFLVINGPNLNMMHFTEPGVAGQLDYNGLLDYLELCCTQMGMEVEFFQSNHEGDLIDAIHGARGRCAAIVINPGAFTHYAWALHDALAAYEPPVVELHLSNPATRESFRHLSVVAPVASGTIAGFGGAGYRLAVEALVSLLEAEGA